MPEIRLIGDAATLLIINLNLTAQNYLQCVCICRQNKDGKACLLKAICEVSQISTKGVGSFMEEILKTIFR